MDNGYIILPRDFFNRTIWQEPREYSRAEAALDLIQSARFEAKSELVNSRTVEVQRGEVIASRRYLEKRWGWSNTRVVKFIEYLRRNGMITTRNENGVNIITLCEPFIPTLNAKRQQKRQQKRHVTDCVCDSYSEGNATKNATKNATETPKQNKGNKDYLSTTTPTRVREESFGDEYLETESVNDFSQSPEKGCAEKVPPQGTYEYLPVRDFGEWLKGYTRWFDAFCMNNGYAPEFVRGKIDEFVRDCENNGDTTKDKRDGIRHFNNWLRKRRDNYGNETDNKRRASSGYITIDEFDRLTRERVARRLAGTYQTGK